jgi:hypothetical protein
MKTDQTELYTDHIQSTIQEHIHQVLKERDTMVKKMIEDAGFFFDTEADLIHFCKTRCQMVHYETGEKEFKIDGKPLFRWYETSKVDFKATNIVASIEVGFKPIKP